MIAIINCGTGNLNSVKSALDYIGARSKIAGSPKEVSNAERIILPGVGAFGFMMQRLREKKLEQPIMQAISDGKPFLGICLGMQALFEESEESPGIKGLSAFEGKVVRFRKGKVPQIGWNSVEPRKAILRRGEAYFVNSYYPVPKDKRIIAATSNYEIKFTSAVSSKNILAVQFHPEKSGKYGLSILERWAKC